MRAALPPSTVAGAVRPLLRGMVEPRTREGLPSHHLVQWKDIDFPANTFTVRRSMRRGCAGCGGSSIPPRSGRRGPGRRRCPGRRAASVETVYAITSWGTATPIPGCWPVGSAHTGPSRTPCTASETSPRVRTTQACGQAPGPQVMAALLCTAINIIRLRGGTNIAAAHREFRYRPADVLDALTAAPDATSDLAMPTNGAPRREPDPARRWRRRR